ncbi:hypothetical protein TNCT_122621 [Trichonephila clavata]|uniref:Uncharacterized protein n=1 Tax=Trichonephila clavata TaxID=2740835 RepID=A0A8X6HYC3_TRICU|nr:hypothetical protein TNCT_122621 [Trichonephila clavata]
MVLNAQKNNEAWMQSVGVVLIHEKDWLHTVNFTKKKFHWELFDNPPFSLAPSNFDLKKFLSGHHFSHRKLWAAFSGGRFL